MRLPIRERQIAQPAEQVQQPIEQSYDLKSPELDKAQGQLMQNIGQVAQARADQLHLQYRNAVSNQINLTYQEQAQEKHNELLGRQGMDAAGVAHDFNVYHNEIAQPLLTSIENPEDREAMRVQFEKSRLQYEDQLAGHQIVQIKEANQKVFDANNQLDLMSAFQYSTDDNIKSKAESIRIRVENEAKANGLPAGVASAKIKSLNGQMISGIVKNYAVSDDYVTAKARLEAHADMLGGKESQQYKELDLQVSDLKFKFELSNTAGNIVLKNFKDPNGMTKAYQAVEGMKLNPEKRDLLLKEVGQKWAFAKAQVQERTERILDIYGNEILNIQMKMRRGEISPEQVAKKYMPLLDKLQFGDENSLDIGSVKTLREHLWKAIESETNKRIAQGHAAAQARTASEMARDREARAREKAEVTAQEIDMFNTLRNNPASIKNMGQMMDRWRKVDLGKIKELASLWGVYNNMNIDIGTMSKTVQKDFDATTAGLNADQNMDAVVKLSQYVSAGVASFNQKYGRGPNPMELDQVYKKAVAETAIDKSSPWFGKNPHYLNFELSQPFQYNGKTYRHASDGLFYEVDTKTKKVSRNGLSEFQMLHGDYMISDFLSPDGLDTSAQDAARSGNVGGQSSLIDSGGARIGQGSIFGGQGSGLEGGRENAGGDPWKF